MVKVRLTIRVPPETIQWVDKEVEKGHFPDRSHAVQYSLQNERSFFHISLPSLQSAHNAIIYAQYCKITSN